jgi:hypothetical protein
MSYNLVSNVTDAAMLWESIQTAAGYGYSRFRNMIGDVDRVDYLGGATFATNENSPHHRGVTFGNYINMDINGEITGDFATYVTTVDPMYMHEYGHTIDSRGFGFSYLLAIGVPSGISAWSDKINDTDYHNSYWTETSANRRAVKYFGNHYNVDWDSPYPHGYKGKGELRQDNEEHWYWHDYTYEDYYPTK